MGAYLGENNTALIGKLSGLVGTALLAVSLHHYRGASVLGVLSTTSLLT